MGYEIEAELRYEVGLGSRALSARRPGTSELRRISLPRTPVNGVVCSEGIKGKDDVPTMEMISTDAYRR
jgi:hypothetical protein